MAINLSGGCLILLTVLMRVKITIFLVIFSSAAFDENFKVLSQPCCLLRWRHVKTLTFSNISVITEDIYLKLRLVVYLLSKGEPIPVGEIIFDFL